MSEQLITNIFDKLKIFKDPLTNEPLDQNNSNLTLLCKDGHANITINIDPQKREKYNKLSIEIKKTLENISELQSVNIALTSEKNPNPAIKHDKNFEINASNIIAVASGKGGVGKSTFAVNLSVALSKLGLNVGLLDADIYGPSIPRMMGIKDKPKINEHKKLVPLENYNIKCMSIGFIIDGDNPAIWRGPMVMKALEQMYNGVEWGKLDYLIIDLPPGTGDAQITLAQNAKLNGSIIISTPQEIALIDARKSINMFKKVGVPITGMVENMSYFICNNCNEKHSIFSSGNVKNEANEFKTNFLGELPIDINIRKYADEGTPICIAEPNSNITNLYLNIAKKIVDEVKSKHSFSP